MLEQHTLTDGTVQHTLEPYTHIQLWGDTDPDAKALMKSWALRPAYPTLVFLDSRGQPAFTTVGYKKPAPFLAECIKASDLLGVAVPDDARAAANGISPNGTVPRQKPQSITKAPVNDPRVNAPSTRVQQTADDWPRDLLPHGGMNPNAAYDPLKDASFNLNAGNYDTSIAILTKVLQSEPRNIRAHYLLAISYVYSHKYGLASDEYKQVIELQPGSRLAVLARQGLEKIQPH
ncbi:MAG TPA: hypothetical protein V6D22_13975 [Candidatus Obscuribacterales bacterium]